jgi:transcription antitermination factor NusG
LSEFHLQVTTNNEFAAFTAQPPHCWYALYTRSHFEKRVADALNEKGVTVYLPTVREIHRWKDRNKAVDLPLFPGYLFVRMADTDASRLQVLRTNGTVRILGQGDTIEPIPALEIESVQRILSSSVCFGLHPFLREGAWVRVNRGPLQGVEGQLMRFTNGTRLIVSIHLLRQSIAAEVDGQDVEPVRQAGR